VRPRAKVTMDTEEMAYKKSIGIKMNNLDLCLDFRGRFRSCHRHALACAQIKSVVTIIERVFTSAQDNKQRM